MTKPTRSTRPLVGLLLRLLHREHVNAVDAALAAAGFNDIGPPHANVFPFVPAEGIQVGTLAALAGVRKQSMAQFVEELESAGYVVRRQDPKDRRARLVFLTARGRRVRPIAVAAGRRVEVEWARLIGSDELENLRSNLQVLLARIREERGDKGV